MDVSTIAAGQKEEENMGEEQVKKETEIGSFEARGSGRRRRY